MEVNWDLNELDETLLLDETIVVDETFEELEQSILSILSEEDGGLALSPIPKTSLQNVHRSDFKNHLSLNHSVTPVNDENKFQQNSPILSVKEKKLKRHHLDSVTDYKSSAFDTKKTKIKFQSLDSSLTSRSPRKILTVSQKENLTGLTDNVHADHRSTDQNSQKNVFQNRSIENVFKKISNSPLKNSEGKNTLVRSPKLPLKRKKCRENQDTLIKLSYPSPKHSLITCPPYSIADITAIESINNQNEDKLPKFTQLILPSSEDNFNHSLNVPSIQCNAFLKGDANTQTSVKGIIQKQFLGKDSKPNNKNTVTQELPHKNTLYSSSFTPIATINSAEDDPDAISLFADDELEMIEIDAIIDKDALLDCHEDTKDDFCLSERKEVQSLKEIKQIDTSADHRKTQFSCEVSCSSQITLKNDFTSETKNATCSNIKNNVIEDIETIGKTAVSHQTLPTSLNFQSSPQNNLKNDNFECDDPDAISIFVVEELEFELSDKEDAKSNKNIEDNEAVNVISEKRKNNLPVVLPVTQNETSIESQALKSTIATITFDKIEEISSIPKAEVSIQNLKKPEPECKVLNEVGKQLSENIQTENTLENITQVKRVFKPFKSADPEENKDIDHPEWEHVKKLTTDEERYQDVKRRWKSKTVPNLNRDLTYHSFRKRRVQAGSVPCSSVKKRQKRKGDNSLKEPVRKRIRTKTVPCTYLIDDKIKYTKKQFSEDAQTAKQTYVVESQSLYQRRLNAESQLVAQIRNPYYCQPYYNQDYNQFQFLATNHEIAKNALFLKHDAQMKAIQSSHNVKLDSLNRARQEIEKFCKFYKGLSKSADGESDPTVITENQMKELSEIENVFLQFDKYYEH